MSGFRARRRLAVAAVLVMVAVDLPAVVVEAAPESGSAREQVRSEPRPSSEPRDLAAELNVGGGEVSVDGGVAAPERRDQPVERVREQVEWRSEGSETWTTTDGAYVTEFYGQPKWFRSPEGAWERVEPTTLVTAGLLHDPVTGWVCSQAACAAGSVMVVSNSTGVNLPRAA